MVRPDGWRNLWNNYVLSRCLAFLFLFAVVTADSVICYCICPMEISRNSDNYVESFLVQSAGVRMLSRVSALSVLLSLVPRFVSRTTAS